MPSYTILVGAIRADDNYNICNIFATHCAVKSLIPMMLSVRFHVKRSRIYMYMYTTGGLFSGAGTHIIYASTFVSVTRCANAKGWKIITREKKQKGKTQRSY